MRRIGRVQSSEYEKELESIFRIEIDMTQFKKKLLHMTQYFPDNPDENFYGVHFQTRKSLGTILGVVQRILQDLLPNDHATISETQHISLITDEKNIPIESNEIDDGIPLHPLLDDNNLTGLIESRIRNAAQQYNFRQALGSITQIDICTGLGRFCIDKNDYGDRWDISILSNVHLCDKIIEMYKALTEPKRLHWVAIEDLREIVCTYLEDYMPSASANEEARNMMQN